MNLRVMLGLGFGLALAACAQPPAARLLLLDGSDPPVSIQSGVTVQQAMTGAGIRLQAGDRVIINGEPIGVDDRLPAGTAGVLQVQRALHVTVNGKELVTSAETVGQALVEAGNDLYGADSVDPPEGTNLEDGMDISYVPSVPVTVLVDGASFQIRTSRPSVEESMAEAGFALVGLDTANPPGTMPDRSAGPIALTRVAESLSLEAESIPFSTEYQDAPDVGLGQERLVHAGAPGMALTRTKVLYEDGHEVSRSVDGQTVVRAPQTRVVARGTKIVEQTSNINGASISYWLKTQMYATVYSPCNSDGAASKCSYGTASGLRAGKGVVAVDPTLYASLNGQRLYIPGYGFAVIGDLGGGYIFESSTGISRYKWIDLGFDDGSIQDMSGWITVYFLAPAPAAIPSVLK